MSDGPALLRGICESPADDALRLIYADWCDENGQPERAEFVRVQCELARLPLPPVVECDRVQVSGGPPPFAMDYEQWGRPREYHASTLWQPGAPLPVVGDVVDLVVADRSGVRYVWLDVQVVDARADLPPGGFARYEIVCRNGEPTPHRRRAEKLRARERELIHNAVFWGVEYPFPAHPDNGWCVWRRGFIESVKMPAADWLAHHHALAWHPAHCPHDMPATAQPLTTVRLTTRPEWAGNGPGNRPTLFGDPGSATPGPWNWEGRSQYGCIRAVTQEWDGQSDQVAAVIAAEWPWLAVELPPELPPEPRQPLAFAGDAQRRFFEQPADEPFWPAR